MNASQLNFLQWILQCKRPHGSKGLDTFVDALFASYEHEIYRNPAGVPLAVVITVGTSRTLFSCHIDTVHHEDGFQAVVYDEKVGEIRLAEREVFEPEEVVPTLSLAPKSKVVSPLSNWNAYKRSYGCLGADDGAGIWLMMEMIDANIPGAYFFHFGEEKGGIGSTGMASHHQDFLTQFDRAVAFDRRGTCSIITHQGFGRCCSDTFADALSAALGDANPKVDTWPDSTGIFTDTANYTDFIGECTNVSCGYDAEHSDSETLNVTFLSELRDAVIKVDWENLPTDRQPGEEEIPAYNAWGGYGSLSRSSYAIDDLEYLAGMRYRDLLDWVRKHDAESIADVLYEALAEMQPAPGSAQNGVYFEDEDYL